jgi:8-oxo-dGTP pyrophosphatase MutT (NUDIX family)
MRRRDVVTCLLQHEGRVLVLKRSDAVRTHRGKWAGVSGGVDADTPLKQAFQEILEETGLGVDELQLIRQGKSLDIEDTENDVNWCVHPFLFSIADPSRVRLDWEHTESRWVDPSELESLDTVPRLKETWERL